MRDEVYMVVRFVATKLIADRLPKHITAKICETLTRELYKKFDKHWHPRNPLVGNAYRAITSSSGKLDKLLRMAFLDNGVKLDVAARFMPADFAIWCDPGDVSVRLGQDGSVWSVEHATAPTEAPSIPRNAYPGANNDLVPKSKHLDISPMSITPIKISQPQGRSRLGLRSGCPPVGWTSNKVLGDVSNIRTFRTMVAA